MRFFSPPVMRVVVSGSSTAKLSLNGKCITGIYPSWLGRAIHRHLGVFPEQATHWDWIRERMAANQTPINVLNLFGYTGIASLAAVKAGANVTHLDASKKIVQYAKENQQLSGLDEKPIRWIIDDAVKFVMREARRGVHYEGIILDPPKFGRGPKGEVWEFFKMLPYLLQEIKPCWHPNHYSW